MIKFEKYTLSNGLKLIVHQDKTTPVAALNLLYDVGARDESVEKTGFAHLFEHLMFGGSVNIPDFDMPLQAAGGTSNAFTSNDITNYYETIPLANLETLMWLESDRMLSLAFTDKSLEVQRSVVIEEFKQRCINQPYGDIWHILRDTAFKVHPYRWPTIGLEISHIEEAKMQDVKDFFFKHYTPHNAILCIAGDVVPDEVFEKTEYWFGRVPARTAYVRNLPQEPKQESHRLVEVTRDVPQSMLLKAWHIVERTHRDYPAIDLLSDLLSKGKSSRLYRALVTEQKLFTEVHCYVTGEHDPGLIVINGMLRPGVKIQAADSAVDLVLAEIMSNAPDGQELEKVKNKYLSAKWFDESTVLSKAMNLCYFELLGNAELVNSEGDAYRKVSVNDISRLAKCTFVKSAESTIYYHAKNQKES